MLIKHIKEKWIIIKFKLSNRLLGYYLDNMWHIRNDKRFKYLYRMWVAVCYAKGDNYDMEDFIYKLDELCIKLNIKNNIKRLYDLTFLYSLYDIVKLLKDDKES